MQLVLNLATKTFFFALKEFVTIFLLKRQRIKKVTENLCSPSCVGKSDTPAMCVQAAALQAGTLACNFYLHSMIDEM